MADTPDEERSILSRLASTFSEANWLLILSATAYLFAYYFDKAYLAYFAVDSVFVEVSTQKVLLSATAFIGIFVIVWQVLGGLPAIWTGRILAAFIAMRIWIVLGIVAILVFLTVGFSWLFFGLALISTFGLVFHFFSLRSVMKTGGSFGDFVEKEISEEAKFEDKTVRGKLMSAFGDKGLVLAMLIFFAPLVAGLTGSHFASTKSSFQVFTVESKTYILVGTKLASGLTAVSGRSMAAVHRSG